MIKIKLLAVLLAVVLSYVAVANATALVAHVSGYAAMVVLSAGMLTTMWYVPNAIAWARR
jgi:hypothetical protein